MKILGLPGDTFLLIVPYGIETRTIHISLLRIQIF